jgi:hypothetical protein
MLYAFKIGPLEVLDGTLNAYVGFTEKGPLEPLQATSDRDGLKRLGALAPGERLVCEPALAKAGRRLGFVAAPAPAWAAPMRAVMALRMALGEGVRIGEDPEPLLQLLDAGAAYLRSEPWQFFDDEDPVTVSVTEGAPARDYACAVMGSAGQEFGVALYDDAEAIARLARLAEKGPAGEVMKVDSLGVTMSDEWDFAARAAEDAFGIPLAPAPMKLRGGDFQPMDAQDLLTLAAALRAVAALTPFCREASAAAHASGARVAVRARAADRR